ncbi:hypothetical protein TCAL_17207 [Tigriopus californicus]|uniref:IMD domain-containing protein n=1 Tax=Tigriopus californicus TaxID=6832 RepID=A0A553N8U6_TIGCA|nr:hypothetical protein TCAL_17207 [Tigriopus californicus]
MGTERDHCGKNGVPYYDDFVNKANKLHGQLKSTILVLSSFLDTFQKIADAATNTKEIVTKNKRDRQALRNPHFLGNRIG